MGATHAKGAELVMIIAATDNLTFRNGGTLTSRLDYSYVGQYWRANDPTLRVRWYAGNGTGIPEDYSDESGDFSNFNARLTYTPAEGNWDIALFGTNLTDEYQLNSGFFHGIWGYDFATVGRRARPVRPLRSASSTS